MDALADNAAGPLSRLRLPPAMLLVDAPDLEAARPVIERLHSRFEWRRMAGARHGDGGVHVHGLRWGALALSMLDYGSCVDIRPEGLGPMVLATTVLRGRLEQRSRAGACAGASGTTLLASGADVPGYRYGEHAEVLKLGLPQARIDALCWQMLGHAGKTPVRFMAQELDGAGASGWLALLGYLMQTISRPETSAKELLAEHLEKCFILHLLQTVPHNYSDALGRDAQDAPRPRLLHRAREYMQACWQEPLTLADIAAAAGCSVRTLTRVFHSNEKLAPMQFLQELRLQHAHAALQARMASGDTVAAVAMRCGFNHLGEFNRQYRRRFGEPPSHTTALQSGQ